MADYRSTKNYLIGIKEKRISSNKTQLTFCTSRGSFNACAEFERGMRSGVIMLGDDSSSSMNFERFYSNLADKLFARGIASLRLNYRHPGVCAQCAIDALYAIQYLDDEFIRNIVLVGWGFGGIVAIGAGAVAKNARGIVGISSMDVANSCIKCLSDKSLLLMHGECDNIVPLDIARKVYSEASDFCKLIVYRGVGHDLSAAHDTLIYDLINWTSKTLNLGSVAV